MRNLKNELITGCENCDLNCGVNVMGKMCGQERPDCNHWTAEKIGEWWADKSIPLYEIWGRIYALSGWNGEKFIRCWECTGAGYMDASKENYVIAPVYDDDGEIIDYVLE